MELFHEEAKGGISGGSAESLLDFHEHATPADRRGLAEDPYLLTPQHLEYTHLVFLSTQETCASVSVLERAMMESATTVILKLIWPLSW